MKKLTAVGFFLGFSGILYGLYNFDLQTFFFGTIMIAGCRARGWKEFPLAAWSVVNIYFIWLLYDVKEVGIESFFLPWVADALIMALISSCSTISRLSYYILISTIVSFLINGAFVLVYFINPQLITDNYYSLCFVPLAIVLIGTLGRGQYDRVSSGDNSSSLWRAFPFLHYQAHG